MITNTTTGDTLVTALVPADPGVDGVLDPGASLAEQYPFTLPTGADGVGNMQITVTANVNHSAFESATSLTNANLQTYTNGGDFPSAPTTLTVGGVDFALIPRRNNVPQPGRAANDGKRHVVRHPGEHQRRYCAQHADQLHLREAGDTVGTVEVKGTGGADAVFNLVEGTNIRDFNNDGYNNTIAPGTPSASFGSGQVRLDMQTFVLPECVRHCPDHGHHLHKQRRHSARESVPGGGDRDDGIGPVAARSARQRRGARHREQSTHDGRLRKRASRPGVDRARPRKRLGRKGDDLTNDTTPTFDVTVNEAGLIQVDFKGDGTSTASQTVTAAGTYSIHVAQPSPTAAIRPR